MTPKEFLASKGIFSLDTKKRTNEVVAWLSEYAELQVKNFNISAVSNRYIVRDWMVSEVFEFDNYKDAKNKYDEIYGETKDAECDIQLYQILHDFNNVG